MSIGFMPRSVGFVRAWVRLYTAGLPPGLRDSRREEIDADLWEQAQEVETKLSGGYVNRCVNDIRRRPSQPLIQWRFHPHTVHRDRRLRSTQGPSDA